MCYEKRTLNIAMFTKLKCPPICIMSQFTKLIFARYTVYMVGATILQSTALHQPSQSIHFCMLELNTQSSVNKHFTRYTAHENSQGYLSFTVLIELQSKTIEVISKQESTNCLHVTTSEVPGGHNTQHHIHLP